MSNANFPSRRQFLANSAGLLSLSALPVYLNACQPVDLKDHLENTHQQQIVILVTANDVNSKQFASVFAGLGMTVVTLGIDPVRQWRDGLSELVRKKAVLGLTQWSDYFMVRGLAAEQRKFPLLEAQRFLPEEQSETWAEKHAYDLLQLSWKDDMEKVQMQLKNSVLTDNAQGMKKNSMFSWVIA